MVKVSLVKNIIFEDKKFLVVDGIALLYPALSPIDQPTNQTSKQLRKYRASPDCSIKDFHLVKSGARQFSWESYINSMEK